MREIMFFDSHLYFKHRIAKRYNLDPNLEKVRVVQSDLSQVFGILIKNAIEAMYASPLKKLTMSTSQDGRNIYVDFGYRSMEKILK
jgi:C4-dicarboxylate-specific signal transduction histidine kinase